MTNNWFGGSSTPSDPSTFNYDIETQKLARQRQAAQALQALAAQSNQGQFIKSGDFTGFAGGNTAGSTLARILASVLGANANSEADDKQKQLAQDSQDALTWAMDPKNSLAGQRAAAAQAKSESDEELQREASRTIQGGERIDPNADQSPDVQTFAVATPTTTTIPLAQAAAKALGSMQGAASSGASPSGAAIPAANAPTGPTQSVTGGPQSFGSGGGVSRKLGSPTKLPTGASGSLSPSDIAFAAKLFGGGSPSPAPALAGNVPGTSQNVTGATGPTPSAPAMPPMPQQSQSPVPQPQPQMAAPAAPQPQMAQQQEPTAPIGDPRSMIDQAVANAQPTQAEQIAQLQAIARTGPMGQQMATAQMNNLFGSKVGRYKTTVMADPVNGGFIQVTEDSATGATQHQRIGGGGEKLVTGQTTDEHGNRLNVHKDGSTSAMLDGSGKPVVDSSVVARNDEQTAKIGAAVQSNANAQAAIDTALARNKRIAELYDSTETGPFVGHLPNWSKERQELQALLAQDLFGETRNALAGAGDAGGAPRMAQSEFRYMQENGGLKQTTNAQTAKNLIASMNEQLLKQKQALQDYAAKLQTTAPSAASAVPARGQQVSAAQYGFK
jgi:hypothetical protein